MLLVEIAFVGAEIYPVFGLALFNRFLILGQLFNLLVLRILFFF